MVWIPREDPRRAHKKKRDERARNKAPDKFLLSSRWKKLREKKLSDSPVCEQCKKRGVIVPGREVDHIKPRSERPDLSLSIDNLQTLCKSCHSRKTAREKNRERPGGGPD